MAEGCRHGPPDYAPPVPLLQARLDGRFLDIRGQRDQRPKVCDPASYAASQVVRDMVRSAGGAGIVWDSLRHAGGTCAVSFRTRVVPEVVQTSHVEITVTVRQPRVEVRRLAGRRSTD